MARVSNYNINMYSLFHWFLKNILVLFFNQVSFGRDFEQQLSFCVEARATFCNLEPVIIHLIHVSSLMCYDFIPGIFKLFYNLEAPPEINWIFQSFKNTFACLR